jgi:hypothetical protein
MVALSTPSSVVVRSTAPSILASAPPDAPWRPKTSKEGKTVCDKDVQRIARLGKLCGRHRGNA